MTSGSDPETIRAGLTERQAKILLRAVLDHIPDSLYFKDRDSRLLQVNKAIRMLLSDVNMPEMDGFSLVQQLRDDSDLHELPIILLTSGIRSDDAARCRATGNDAWPPGRTRTSPNRSGSRSSRPFSKTFSRMNEAAFVLMSPSTDVSLVPKRSLGTRCNSQNQSEQAATVEASDRVRNAATS